jgi:hypothetical protein
MSLFVRTVTGVPRREPWRPYGRIVSPERELQLLSTDPWRPTDSGFLVIVTGLELHYKMRVAGTDLPLGEGCLRRRA